jgi:hypothetical protein
VKRIVPLLLLVAACHSARTYTPTVARAPRIEVVAAPTVAPEEIDAETEASPRNVGWLTGVPEQWIATANADGTIELAGASGAVIAVRGAGDCEQFSYPPPVGELEYGDLDVQASRPWNAKIGYVLASGSDVYCRALGEGEVMVIIVPSGVVDPTEVLASVAPDS